MLKAKSDSTRSLLGTWIGHFLNDGANNLFPVVYPVLLKSYNMSLEFIGILATLYSLSSLVASPFIGRRSDYNESYLRLIPLGLIIVTFGILGFALSIVFFPGNLLYFGLVLFTFVAGFGSSFYHPIAAAILNETWPFERRGRAMGFNGSMGGVGTLAFPIITVGLIVLFGVKSLSLVAIAFILLAITIYVIMKNIAAPEHPRSSGAVERKVSSGVPMRIVLPTVLALTLAGFFPECHDSGRTQFSTHLPEHREQIPYQYVGSVQVAYAIFAIVGQPLFGSLSDRYGRKAMIGVTLLGCVGSVILAFGKLHQFLADGIQSRLVRAVFLYWFSPVFRAHGADCPEGRHHSR